MKKQLPLIFVGLLSSGAFAGRFAQNSVEEHGLSIEELRTRCSEITANDQMLKPRGRLTCVDTRVVHVQQGVECRELPRERTVEISANVKGLNWSTQIGIDVPNKVVECPVYQKWYQRATRSVDINCALVNHIDDVGEATFCKEKLQTVWESCAQSRGAQQQQQQQFSESQCELETHGEVYGCGGSPCGGAPKNEAEDDWEKNPVGVAPETTQEFEDKVAQNQQQQVNPSAQNSQTSARQDGVRQTTTQRARPNELGGRVVGHSVNYYAETLSGARGKQKQVVGAEILEVIPGGLLDSLDLEAGQTVTWVGAHRIKSEDKLRERLRSVKSRFGTNKSFKLVFVGKDGRVHTIWKKFKA